MSKLQSTCPTCGSHKMRIIDNEPLDTPNPNTQTSDEELYQWDEEIYALTLCDDCGHTHAIEGTINWN